MSADTQGSFIDTRNVIFVAAENGALPGAKVGGVGDVIRDLPAAVDAAGWPATVLTPSYGRLHELEGAAEVGAVTANFRGHDYGVAVYEIPHPENDVRYVVLDHEFFAPTEPGIVYHDDTASRPFATDADKFAFFCASAAEWIVGLASPPAAIHLHDWHAGLLAVLRAFDPGFEALQRVPIYFTIHNLSYQGQRPLADDYSSLEAWFPNLEYDLDAVKDPNADDAVNPMAAAIRLADRVNAVSPTYAEEILRPSDAASGFIGGEGLEDDLRVLADDDRLVGILNGCDYDLPPVRAPRWTELLRLAQATIRSWPANDLVHEIALARLRDLGPRRPLHVLTSVGRIVDQKMRLMLETTASGNTALEDVLATIGDNAVLFLLGSGEQRYEARIAAIAREHGNLVFVRGYAETLGDALYASGDLFLMPSGFEPCGISQMLAMRAGQPCVVHGVGGLRDTVDDGVNGFVFEGDSPRAQATAFVQCVQTALALRTDNPLAWQDIVRNARAARFEWSGSARDYIRMMYEYRQS